MIVMVVLPLPTAIIGIIMAMMTATTMIIVEQQQCAPFLRREAERRKCGPPPLRSVDGAACAKRATPSTQEGRRPEPTKEKMKVISQTELMRLSRGELMVMQRRIAGALIIMRVKAPPARASAMLTLSALPDL